MHEKAAYIPSGINEQQFTAEILDIVTDLERLDFDIHNPGGTTSGVVSVIVGIGSIFTWWPRRLRRVSKKKKQELEQAATIVREQAFEPVLPGEKPRLREVLRTALCPALKSISGDLLAITKISTPILLSLSLAGSINLPAQPLIFGMVIVIIARSGVATVCPDSAKDSSDKTNKE